MYAGLIDGPTSIPPDAPVEVFNFAGLPEPIIPFAMMLLIEYLWAVIERRIQPALFVMDEGWSLLKNPASARFVEECTRRGRHHGIATLNMSQQVEDYMGDVGKAVIDNTSVTLLLSQSNNSLGKVGSVFRLSEDELTTVASLRTDTRVGAGAYLHSREGADSGSLRLYVTPEEYWLFTSHPPERDQRECQIEACGGDVWAAVCHLARYGDGVAVPEAANLQPLAAK